MLHTGECAPAIEHVVSGQEVGLYVGETYRLRVPRSSYVDEASVDFAPSAADARCAQCQKCRLRKSAKATCGWVTGVERRGVVV